MEQHFTQESLKKIVFFSSPILNNEAERKIVFFSSCSEKSQCSSILLQLSNFLFRVFFSSPIFLRLMKFVLSFRSSIFSSSLQSSTSSLRSPSSTLRFNVLEKKNFVLFHIGKSMRFVLLFSFGQK